MSACTYSHLLSPGRIGKMQLRNRITVTAMGVNLAEEGHCTERIRDFHIEQAKGGAGLVNLGVSGVAWPTGGNQPGQVAISDDRFIPGLKAMADGVHAHGAKFTIQIHQGGLVSVMDMIEGREVWIPSLPKAGGARSSAYTDAFLLDELARSPSSRIKSAPKLRVMSIEDIHFVTEQFAAAADRAKRAGADGVEIHGGHGYLLSSFVSPKSNHREDEYGGPLENRVRFLLEVVQAVRARTGKDFAILVKIDSQEFGVPNGITLDDAVRTARMVEAAGADAITVSSYHDTAQIKLHSGSNIPHEPCLNLPAAARIKAAVKIPVIASGRVDPEIGDARIAAGEFDFLAMGRKLLADPDLPNKLKAGRPETVRPCVYCYTCVSAIYTGDPVRCAVNPYTALEFQRKPVPTQTRRRYVVVGGGTGGMEAASRLKVLGHEVILLEAGGRLGGTLQFASLAYEANQRLLEWLRHKVAESGVEVRLNTSATPELVRSLKPDAVLVATGAKRAMPPIPGGDQTHVLSGDDMRNLMLGMSSPELSRKVGLPARLATRIGAMTGITANLGFVRKASEWWMPLGKRIVIIGGELVGLELAEFLVLRGRQVAIVDDIPRFGGGLMLVRRMRALEELREHGVGLHAEVKDIAIVGHEVRFTDKTGQAQALTADQVIVAKGATGNSAVADALRAAGLEVHAFGDCTGVGYIEGAIRGASAVVETLTQSSGE
ncbi:MAG: FAD-dependent oxidoreductase [Proteobacteria bacterium]|nr:FAD-dependent oxidoreductase [Pseudomonadota bacterium]HQR04649.1 FAD-dependent oxidoreductase [Rhodocyclaceae bacterium]